MPIQKKSFLYLLISEGAIGIGETFLLMAETALLIRMTGSGLSAGFSLICTPIASVFFSSFAGNLGDGFSGKALLILLDLLKAAVVLSFPFCTGPWLVYALIFLLALLNVFHNPPKKKLIRTILEDEELIAGNATLSGVSGMVYLLVPPLAALVIRMWGMERIYLIIAGFFLFSALMLSLLKDRQSKKRLTADYEDRFMSIIQYFNAVPSVRSTLIDCGVFALCTASVNVAFYAFAFDVMGWSTGQWSILLSALYGANLLAMGASIFLGWEKRSSMTWYMYGCLLLVCIAWFCYGKFESFFIITGLQMLEGTAAALFNIFVITRLQMDSGKAYVSRVMGLNDMINNGGKLLSIMISFWVMQHLSPSVIFLFNALFLALFVAGRSSGKIVKSIAMLTK